MIFLYYVKYHVKTEKKNPHIYNPSLVPSQKKKKITRDEITGSKTFNKLKPLKNNASFSVAKSNI